MRFLNFLVPIALLVFQPMSVYGTCNTSGTKGDQVWAQSNINKICAMGNMAGTYGPGLTHYQCWDTPDGNHYDFVIFNYNSDTEIMQPDECKEFLLKEIGCSRGGDSTYSWNYRYVADPNQGTCVQDQRGNKAERRTATGMIAREFRG